MQKKILLAKDKGQEQKNKRFNSKTAKNLMLIAILIWAVFFIALPVLATTLEVGLGYAAATGLGTQDIRITIASIIRAALGLLGIIAVVIILYGGYIYMTSAGNQERIEKAKKILRDAVIGLIIILSAFGITQFILSYLIASTGGGAFITGPSYGSGGGALGGGIIESHYPSRNAVNIPRNTSIIVTFKEAMDVNSISTNDLINVDTTNQPTSIKIHKTADKNGPYVTNVKAFHTDDLKTFVFKPVDLLGSPTEPTYYTVELTDNIKKFDGNDAFGSYGGYDWKFEVSTVTDLTPPKIVSVIPFPTNDPTKTVPRNIVVQINFNEAINPMTMRGKVELANGQTVGPQLKTGTFDYINVKTADGSFVAGEFTYGNQYKTVEFVTNDLCGKNSCGNDIFCLPANENLSVLVKAASLEVVDKPTAVFPYTGIVDMSDNSLDGNANNTAEGPGAERVPNVGPYNLNNPKDTSKGDDAVWSFYTSKEIDLVPPEIKDNYYPAANATEINTRINFTIPFSKLIMKTTLKPDSGYGDGYCPCKDNTQCGAGNTCDTTKAYCLNSKSSRLVCTPTLPCSTGKPACEEIGYVALVMPSPQVLTAAGYPGGGWAYWLSSDNFPAPNPEQTKATISHETLGGNLDFSIKVGSGVKDLMQNCYLPCSGPGCVKLPTPLPGQYKKGTPWRGEFPSCDLTTFLGDADGDGKITANDLTILTNILSGKPATCYDLNKNIIDCVTVLDFDSSGEIGSPDQNALNLLLSQ